MNNISNTRRVCAVSGGASVFGQGFVTRKGTGEKIPITFRGEADPEIIAKGMGKVQTKQSIKAGLMMSLAFFVSAIIMAPGTLEGKLAAVLAVTHPTSIRNSLADLVVDLIDAGSGAGTLEVQTSGDVEVATLTFSDPAFGAASSGTATANSITSDSSATGGTAAKFIVQDSDSTLVFSGSVGTSGEDINFTSVTIGAGDTVSISSLTYSGPA